MSGLEQLYISISGIIGAGKSTLASALGEELNLPVYYEPIIDNVYLKDFYTNMKLYSFPLQIHLLNKRFSQQQKIIWNKKGGVQDRTIYEDAIFASMLHDSKLMSDRDYNTYKELFINMSNFMCRPNLIVHLDVSPEDSLERIRKRGREMEKDITLEYLKKLYEAYEVFLQDIAQKIPVIRVDYSTFKTPYEMASIIKEKHGKLSNIHHVNQI